MNELLELMRADIACHTQSSAIFMRVELEKAVNVIEEVLLEESCFSLKDLDIDGNDLIQLGFNQGPEIGHCLEHLLDLVISDVLCNNFDDLINESEVYLKSIKNVI